MMSEIRIKRYQKGTSVVVQNAPNPGIFYIVRKGALAIDTEHRLHDKVLSRFEPGDSFGLVSALTGHHFLVTIYADTDAEIAEVPISRISEYLKPDPFLAVKVLRLYSRELRTIQQFLAKLDRRADKDATPEWLYFLASQHRKAGKLHHAAHTLKAYLEWANANGGRHIAEAKAQFEELREHYEEIAFGAEAGTVLADRMIFSEGEIGRDLFVILAGSVKIVRYAGGQDFMIDLLGPGELFGEMAFIEGTPRMGTAITVHDSKIIRLHPEQLVEAVAANVLQKIFECMARRIWFAHQRLIVFKIRDPLIRMYAYLYNLTRNQNLREKEKDPPDRSYTFDINLAQLKTLCGIVRLKEANEADFLANDNLIITEDSITIRSRKKLADRISYYRARSGQIVAETT